MTINDVADRPPAWLPCVLLPWGDAVLAQLGLSLEQCAEGADLGGSADARQAVDDPAEAAEEEPRGAKG
eukprot:CAMPEP_0175752792 /NCGR_PEP_ID=MMETSP0097-20121207/61955_1 /TAXON_ID=311494 /ORGANISM="Alexandrium monilatum, Strain CCMP3105" /LENGTH=68 /DNA_ID=CAMNT_0017061603 /DNA_START=26 /DNA_END=229 /DNA_ORIENTATION=-